jgi:DNA-binding NarL/FixJ family response regulator
VLRLLIVEDTAADAELTVHQLRAAGIECSWERVETEEGFREALLSAPDLIISDGTLPGFEGRAALAITLADAPRVPFIFLSGAPWDHRAHEALAAGAADFVCKAERGRIVAAVRGALQGGPSATGHPRG